jgi:hypothetical protein
MGATVGAATGIGVGVGLGIGPGVGTDAGATVVTHESSLLAREPVEVSAMEGEEEDEMRVMASKTRSLVA